MITLFFRKSEWKDSIRKKISNKNQVIVFGYLFFYKKLINKFAQANYDSQTHGISAEIPNNQLGSQGQLKRL